MYPLLGKTGIFFNMKGTIIHFTYGNSDSVSFMYNSNVSLHIFTKHLNTRGNAFPEAANLLRSQGSISHPSGELLQAPVNLGNPDSSSTSQGFNNVQTLNCRAEPASQVFLKVGWMPGGLPSQTEGSCRAQKLCSLLTRVSLKSNNTWRGWEDSVSHQRCQWAGGKPGK